VQAALQMNSITGRGSWRDYGLSCRALVVITAADVVCSLPQAQTPCKTHDMLVLGAVGRR
jgi:hypothetical protein